MRSRLVIIVVLVVAVTAVVFAINRLTSSASPPAADPVKGPTLPSRAASYLGVYEKGPPTTYQPVANFAKVVAAQPNLVGYYSGWGEPFKTSFARTVLQHGAATIVQMDPEQTSVAKIAAGHYDAYLTSFADSIRAFGHPVVIGFGHEMNAYWYSWGYGQTDPKTFVAAWRHVVAVFREQHVKNVTWLWTLQADEAGTGPIAPWWPGASYVTWVGIDGYYYQSYETFDSIFGKTIAQVRAFTKQPVLLSETAVGPQAGQAAKIPNLFAGIHQYGTLGLVWFDIPQNNGVYHQNWHLENNASAEVAFPPGCLGDEPGAALTPAGGRGPARRRPRGPLQDRA